MPRRTDTYRRRQRARKFRMLAQRKARRLARKRGERTGSDAQARPE